MSGRNVFISLILAFPLSAQPGVENLVERIERYAAMQERRMGLDTRLAAAARLRVIAPAAARRLLEGGLPALQTRPGGEPDYYTFRVLHDYASIDIDAAEKAAAMLKDQVWAWTALIDQATRQRDLTRAVRLSRSAVEAGHYSLGAIVLLLNTLAKEDPARVAPLQDDLLRAFPGERASLANVRSLLEYAGASSPIDPKRGQEAARLAFAALDRADIRPRGAEFENIGAFSVGGSKVETATSFETTLLPAAAFLAVFQPEEYRKRAAELPAWGPKLAALTAADLSSLLKARYARREARLPSSNEAAPPPVDYRKFSYDELIAYAEKATGELRVPPLLVATRRKENTPEQRERAYRLALEALAAIPGQERLSWRWRFLEEIFQGIAQHRIDALFPEALTQYLSTLDVAARSNDRMSVSDHELGLFGQRYAAVARLLDERGIALPEENPAIEAQRVIREIAALQLRAEDFALPTQDGETVRLSGLEGKVVVLDFWATWCEPCRKAMPDVAAVAREWSGRGVVVLGVDDEAPEVVREYAEKNQLPFRTLIDRRRKVHDLFGVVGIPAAVVIGRDGTLVERVPFPHDAAAFRAALGKAGVK